MTTPSPRSGPALLLLAAVLVVTTTLSIVLLPAAPAQAQACSFQLGFKALRDLIASGSADLVGSCLENEWHNAVNGDALQQTGGGLLVWRKADNWTAFTDGATTWLNGPFGLAVRPNEGPLFAWEAGSSPGQPPAASPGGPPPQPTTTPAMPVASAPTATPTRPATANNQTRPAPTATLVPTPRAPAVGASNPPTSTPRPTSNKPAECGPPSEGVPGPPPRIIRVGQPMSESWLRCYVWSDIEAQDYLPDRFGTVRQTTFQGYPVECWSVEGASARATEALVVELYAFSRGHDQYVRFTYRIQLDGDYINNCAQELT